jgi:hypothetical protein
MNLQRSGPPVAGRSSAGSGILPEGSRTPERDDEFYDSF